MAIAKSAYDLACERIIISKYGDQLAKENKELKRKEKERISSLPDFVADWEIKNNDLSDSNDIEEEKIMPKASSEPTKIFTPEEIRKHRERNNKVEIVETEEIEEAPANEPQEQEEQEQGESNISVPEVHWYGHFTSYGGFSRQNRAFVFGLSNRGVRVKIDMQPLAIDVNSATMKELEFLAKLDVNPKAPKIYSATIPLDMNHNGKKIIYTMMESESLHKNYVDKVNLFDEVWVPTHFAQKQFKKYGVHRQTHVMPLGVDTERYFPTEKVNPASLGFDLNKFVFLSVFKWGYRKGFDILLKAYFDEFSSKDDVSLLLITRCETDNNPERIPSDISNLRTGIDKSDDELPHLVVHTKNVQEKNLPKIYSMSDAFVLPSRGEGFCTLPDAQIKTPNGIRKISEINIGDTVFSHKGESRKVSHTFEREYMGEMIKIRCNGRNNQLLQVTPNHNILVFRLDDISSKTRLKSLNSCAYDKDIDNFIFEKRESLIGSTKYDKTRLEWIRADELKKGDYIFYPKINYHSSCEEYFIENKIDFLKIDRLKERFIIEEDRLFKKIKNQTGTFFKGQKLFNKTSIEMTNDLAKLMGYFVAEGCCSNGAVMFSFHRDEIEYHEEIIVLMKKIFGDINYKKYFSKNKKSCVISFYCTVALEILEYLFGKGARNKRIPNFIFKINNDNKISFLHGLLNGDGYYKRGNTIALSTASIDLANGVFDLFMTIGIKSSVKSRIIKNGYGKGRTYYSVNITNFKDSNKLFDCFKNTDDKTNNIRDCQNIILKDNFELVRVSKIENVNYSGMVYNIGVEEDNSYICENLAVHNCLPYLEAAACGLPVIGSNCSGQSDFLKKENSFLVDPDEMSEVKTNGNMSKLAKHCGFYEGQVFPNFGSTGIKKFGKLMREVYENYENSLNKAQLLTDLVHDEYSWDMAVDRVLKRIKEIV